MAQLSGKHVLLTGASRGVGPVIAEALARRGAHIALAARSEEDLRNVSKALGKKRGRIFFLELGGPHPRFPPLILSPNKLALDAIK